MTDKEKEIDLSKLDKEQIEVMEDVTASLLKGLTLDMIDGVQKGFVRAVVDKVIYASIGFAAAGTSLWWVLYLFGILP